MKYIGNAFSPSMIKDSEGDVLILMRNITENQFRKIGDHAKSCIGHPELAEHFNLPFNRETIHLKKGDMLYIVLPKRRYREGEIVRYGDDKINYEPDKTDFTFKVIQILDKKV